MQLDIPKEDKEEQKTKMVLKTAKNPNYLLKLQKLWIIQLAHERVVWFLESN